MNILKHIDGSMILIFLGTLIVAIGGIWTGIQKSQKDAIISKKNEQIIVSQRLLQAKTQEVSELTKKNECLITGGSSFCYVSFSFYVHGRALTTRLHHMGEHPLYDISVRIIDIQKWKRWKDGEQIASAFEMQPRNITPNSDAVTLFDIPISGSPNELAYHVLITARNGSWIQLQLFSRVNGKWKSAMRVLRRHTEKEVILDERVDDEYPRNENGEIDWNVFKKPYLLLRKNR